MAYIEDRDGKSRVQWDLPKHLVPEGRKSAKGSLTLTSKASAKRAKEIAEEHKHAITGSEVAEILEAERLSKLTPRGLTFGYWASEYIKSKADDWSDGKNRYENLWRFDNVILPALGNREMSSISAEQIRAFLVDLKEKRNQHHATTSHYYANIAQVMNYARDRNGLPVNPLVDKPWSKKPPRSEIDVEIEADAENYFELEEFEQVYGNLRSDAQGFVSVLLETGMRFNEASALRVRDIEEEFNMVRIQRAWPGYYPGLHEASMRPGPTKNRKTRAAYVSDDLLGRLVLRAAGKSRDDFVFLGSNGGKIRNPNFLRDHWNIAMNKVMQCSSHPPTRIDGRNSRETLDLRKRSTCSCLAEEAWVSFTPHSLRHTCASWLIYLGEPIQNVSLLLGHGSVVTTEKTYVHQVRRSRRMRLDQERVTRMRALMPNLNTTT